MARVDYAPDYHTPVVPEPAHLDRSLSTLSPFVRQFIFEVLLNPSHLQQLLRLSFEDFQGGATGL